MEDKDFEARIEIWQFKGQTATMIDICDSIKEKKLLAEIPVNHYHYFANFNYHYYTHLDEDIAKLFINDKRVPPEDYGYLLGFAQMPYTYFKIISCRKDA